MTAEEKLKELKMTIEKEVWYIARYLFNVEISLIQLSAYEEGYDKMFGLPHRSRWSNMSRGAQRHWEERARTYIKERKINIEPLIKKGKME